MIVPAVELQYAEARYRGLRMTATEYFELEEDGCRYELVDGVVCMSPSPTYRHQKVAIEISFQIGTYLSSHPLGDVLNEIDVHLGPGPTGGDLVYRPDVVFVRTENIPEDLKRIIALPDLIVEVVSESSRRYDHETKKGDYERAGIMEYWIIEPEQNTMTFYRFKGDRYIEIKPQGDTLPSEALPGFTLDLVRLRRSFGGRDLRLNNVPGD